MYRGYETTTAEVTIYSHKVDPVLVASVDTLPTTGKFNKAAVPALISVDTQKALGGAAGTWTVTLKPTKAAEEALRNIGDDDWIDIGIRRKGQYVHVMRGLVDSIQETRSVGGSGADVTFFTLEGRDFQKVFEQALIWFNVYTAENVAGAAMNKLWTTENLRQDVDHVVGTLLFDMLRAIGDIGRGTWSLPGSMPGQSITGGFASDNIRFYTSEFTPLNRKGIDPNWMMPQGTVWNLAQEWADPMFCELICDLWDTRRGTLAPPQQDTGLTPEDSGMVVVLRDRPFPHSSRSDLVSNDGVPVGSKSRWFDLPLFTVEPGEVVSSALSRSGHERYNAFFAAPQVLAETQETQGILAQPLWYPASMELHGFRRMDVQTRYIVEAGGNIAGIAASQRERLRDWHALNPYLLAGNIAVGRPLPEIRIGSRFRVRGRSSDLSTTFYVEQVSNTWAFGSGGRTSLGVTRGFRGQDSDLVDQLDQMADRFESPA